MITDKMKNHPRWKQLHVGVRKDGTCENHVVETYLALPLALFSPRQYGYAVDRENRFVAFVIDNGGTDIEVRLPFETVELMTEWIRPKPVPADK